MSLLRVAFECEDKVTRIVVLCAGCYGQLVEQINPSVRRWTKHLNGTSDCEFCLGEARESALR